MLDGSMFLSFLFGTLNHIVTNTILGLFNSTKIHHMLGLVVGGIFMWEPGGSVVGKKIKDVVGVLFVRLHDVMCAW